MATTASPSKSNNLEASNSKPAALLDVPHSLEASRKSPVSGFRKTSEGPVRHMGSSRKISEDPRKYSESTRKISEGPRKLSESRKISTRKISNRKISEKKISFRGEAFELEAQRSYNIEVDYKDNDKAIEIKLCSRDTPHMRNFHFAWGSLFLSFLCWFSFSSLMPEIKKTLNLTDDQVYVTTISSYILTIIARISTGPLCDQFGPRIVQTLILIFVPIPLFFVPLISEVWHIAIIRCLVGILGASFVVNQTWSSLQFSSRCVGLANATAAGWGTLGGGMAAIVMTGIFNALASGVGKEYAWRFAFYLPAILSMLFSILVYKFTTDAPKGNFKDMTKSGEKVKKNALGIAFLAAKNHNVWLLFLNYAISFGVEMHIINIAPLYFSRTYQLETSTAGAISSLYGLMNIFARSLGGYLSDRLFLKYKMKGRIAVSLFALFFEGLFLVFFVINDVYLWLDILILALIGVFNQCANGACYAIVPYVLEGGTGAVSGFVGAGGSVGSISWGILFIALNMERGFLYLGVIVMAGSLSTLFIKVKGYAGLIFGQDENLLLRD